MNVRRVAVIYSTRLPIKQQSSRSIPERKGLNYSYKLPMRSSLSTRLYFSLLRQYFRPDGFTLLELLVVVTIAGILSAIALPSFLNQANKARQAEAKTYVAAINRGQQAYFLEKSTFGDLTNLELAISSSGAYTYSSVPSGEGLTAIAETEASPVNNAKRYAGKTWLTTDTQGQALVKSLVCEFKFDDTRSITTSTCPQ